MLGKWRWRMATDVNSLWFGVISRIHTQHDNRPRQIRNSIWKRIVKSWEWCKENGVDLDTQIRKEVGNGHSTRFWIDNWCCLNTPLKNTFPRLFALEMHKEVMVADRMNAVNGSWMFRGIWRSAPRGRSEMELQQLMMIMHPVEIHEDRDDKWEWKKDEKGTFSVQSLYNALILLKYREWDSKIGHGWNKWIPGKVNMCVWRGVQNRLPTKDNLIKRGVDLSSSLCALCSSFPENIEHIIFECPRVVNIWKKIEAWWGRKYNIETKWKIFQGDMDGKNLSGTSWKIFHGVICVTVWAIWNWRNQVTFSSEAEIEKELQKDIFPTIQSFALHWIKARSGKKMFSWEKWISNPSLLS